MTAFQKVIKYLAIAFAIYLIIMIVGVVFSVFAVIIGLEKWSNSSNQEIIEHNTVEYSDVKNMDIKLGICKLDIKEGEQLKVETSEVTDKFKCEVKNGTLKIEDNKMNTNIFKNKVPQVTIYIPKDYEFNEIDLELGINNSNIYEETDLLSAGEKQIINFARIMAMNPDIIILDEVTSNLSWKNEELIKNAIEKVSKRKNYHYDCT